MHMLTHTLYMLTHTNTTHTDRHTHTRRQTHTHTDRHKGTDRHSLDQTMQECTDDILVVESGEANDWPLCATGPKPS